MYFERTNAPATFTSLMNTIFREYLGIFTLVLMDDILVFFKNEEEHKEHLKKVFDVLRRYKLYAREANVNFFARRLNTLDMCCLTKVSQLIIKKLRLWLGGLCQRIRQRSDAFWGWLLTWENMQGILQRLQPHDGFVERQIWENHLNSWLS